MELIKTLHSRRPFILFLRLRQLVSTFKGCFLVLRNPTKIVREHQKRTCAGAGDTDLVPINQTKYCLPLLQLSRLDPDFTTGGCYDRKKQYTYIGL